ncbi:MAG: hypothetical protein COB39_07125 [Marinosulfonomonas sp.]|nr:DUF1330 domain-containing protein [Marinosulfonomonas sp.]PHQ98854.1 MAG: hypothetical protein COB39_07125 [Marinosulfonomonas sp.]
MVAYAMVHIDVNDADVYAKYAELAGPAVAKYGGEFLARGGACFHMEGKGRTRNVIIRFKDMETAKTFYHSPEYQEALSYGLVSADREYTFVEGV